MYKYFFVVVKYQYEHVPNLFSMVVRFQSCFCFLSSPIISGEGKIVRLQWGFQWEMEHNKKIQKKKYSDGSSTNLR